MTTSTTSTFNTLFSSDESKSNHADVLMTVKGFAGQAQEITLVGARDSKFSMWENFGSEKAALKFLVQKAAEFGCDIKVICAQYDKDGTQLPWSMSSQF